MTFFSNIFFFAVSFILKKKQQNDFPECSSHDTKCQVLGLNLLRLLADDQLASFHCELELLSDKELSSAPVTFATTLGK